MQNVMTETEPLISVVVVCYNYANYVGGAIESVLAQGYARKQIVVVNDGSTDASLEVISGYADRVRIIDQVNQGHIAACNHGYLATAGELVMFLDADDVLEPEALASVAAAWSPAAAKVQFDLKIIDKNGRDLGRRFCNFNGDYDAARVRDSFRRTGTYRWPVTVGNAYARWYLERMMPLTIDDGPDGLLNTVAPVYGDVVTIAKVLGCYRLHGENRWASNGSDFGRLPARIAHRRREVDTMREHARARGILVADDDVLDHELPFINYRLMATRLGLRYARDEQDSPRSLFMRVVSVVRAERLPLHLRLAHVLWSGVLPLLPSGAARALIRLRFNRAAVGEALRERLRSVAGRTTGEQAIP